MTWRNVLRARDGMEKLCRREERDVFSLNLMGILWEQEGMMKQAEQSFSRCALCVGLYVCAYMYVLVFE